MEEYTNGGYCNIQLLNFSTAAFTLCHLEFIYVRSVCGQGQNIAPWGPRKPTRSLNPKSDEYCGREMFLVCYCCLYVLYFVGCSRECESFRKYYVLIGSVVYCIIVTKKKWLLQRHEIHRIIIIRFRLVFSLHIQGKYLKFAMLSFHMSESQVIKQWKQEHSD